jgi:hypothetical protein
VAVAVQGLEWLAALRDYHLPNMSDEHKRVLLLKAAGYGGAA